MILSSLISDGMILQRNQYVNIWGISEPNAVVHCRFEEYKDSTIADVQGEWCILLPPHKAGGPYNIVIDDGEEKIIHDVLFGDVWLLGGQSNMELPISRTLDLYAEEVMKINDPDIRMFDVPKEYDFHGPRDELQNGKWSYAVKENIMNFSAVGYFFAKELKDRYQIPIGLIQTAIGGTPIEAWIPEKELRLIGGYDKQIDLCKEEGYIQKVTNEENEKINHWFTELERYDAKGTLPDWREIMVPGLWNYIKDDKGRHELSFISGSFWLKKEIEISVDMYEKMKDNDLETEVVLGTIVDSDEVFINNVKIGSTAYRYPPRKYRFMKELLKQGKNEIMIHLMVNNHNGGFIPDKEYKLKIGDTVIDLKGIWKYQIGSIMGDMPPQTFFQYKPSGDYNAMIYPLRKFNISGICFYQGESNAGHPEGYRQLLTSLINSYRRLWRAELPFLYIQLPNFSDAVRISHETNWAELREEQRQGLKINNTAMVIAIDTGEYNELHTQNKKVIGERLSLCARKLVYKEDIVISGPLFDHQICFKDRIVLYFTSIGQGLVARGEKLTGFEMCGGDKRYFSSEAVIDGDTVVVFAPKEVKKPSFVQYGFRNNPLDMNLYNEDGFIAAPFTSFIKVGV